MWVTTPCVSSRLLWFNLRRHDMMTQVKTYKLTEGGVLFTNICDPITPFPIYGVASITSCTLDIRFENYEVHTMLSKNTILNVLSKIRSIFCTIENKRS